jgi:hypothetical protein
MATMKTPKLNLVPALLALSAWAPVMLGPFTAHQTMSKKIVSAVKAPSVEK